MKPRSSPCVSPLERGEQGPTEGRSSRGEGEKGFGADDRRQRFHLPTLPFPEFSFETGSRYDVRPCYGRIKTAVTSPVAAVRAAASFSERSSSARVASVSVRSASGATPDIDPDAQVTVIDIGE